MMTIHNMIRDLEHRGFTVLPRYYHDDPNDHRILTGILFTIEKAGVSVSKFYNVQYSTMAERHHQYQLSFLRELVSNWNKKFDQRIDEARVRCNEANINFDKMVLNSIYGTGSPLIWEHKGKPIGRVSSVYADTDGVKIHIDDSPFVQAVANYIDTDILMTKELWPKMNPYINKSTIGIMMPTIKDVIFNNPATIVFWSDGTKTVVKCQEDDIYDPEKGLAMAISKKFFGNKGNYCNEINKWMDKYIEKIADEINPFQIAWDKACETVKQAKLTNDIPEPTKVDTTQKPTVKVLATMEFEVDISVLSPKYSNVVDMAKDIARNELRDLMLNKEINADNFNYEFVIPNKAEE